MNRGKASGSDYTLNAAKLCALGCLSIILAELIAFPWVKSVYQSGVFPGLYTVGSLYWVIKEPIFAFLLCGSWAYTIRYGLKKPHSLATRENVRGKPGSNRAVVSYDRSATGVLASAVFGGVAYVISDGGCDLVDHYFGIDYSFSRWLALHSFVTPLVLFGILAATNIGLRKRWAWIGLSLLMVAFASYSGGQGFAALAEILGLFGAASRWSDAVFVCLRNDGADLCLVISMGIALAAVLGRRIGASLVSVDGTEALELGSCRPLSFTCGGIAVCAEGKGFVLRDLDGTLVVNGKPAKSHHLRDGDHISCSTGKFVFREKGEDPIWPSERIM